jgi:hypothetical protein
LPQKKAPGRWAAGAIRIINFVGFIPRIPTCQTGYRELVFSSMSPEGELPEIVERPDHPWFIGVQFHPELKSKPFDPHPLFASFIGAAVIQSRLA